MLERAGKISNLTTQVKFSLDIEGIHICNYIADFCYDENNDVIVEDCKGVRTPDYKLKAKLMLAPRRKQPNFSRLSSGVMALPA